MGNPAANWFLDLNVAPKAELPFIAVNKTDISSKFHGLDYEVTTPDGEFSKPDNGKVFRIKPGKNTLTLNFATGK